MNKERINSNYNISSDEVVDKKFDIQNGTSTVFDGSFT